MNQLTLTKQNRLKHCFGACRVESIYLETWTLQTPLSVELICTRLSDMLIPAEPGHADPLGIQAACYHNLPQTKILNPDPRHCCKNGSGGITWKEKEDRQNERENTIIANLTYRYSQNISFSLLKRACYLIFPSVSVFFTQRSDVYSTRTPVKHRRTPGTG